MSWRERQGLITQALAALARHTRTPHRLVVLDFGLPPALRAAVAAQAPEIVPVPDGTWPTVARGRIAVTLDTPFAVFMDNDVIVQPGWLEPLLDCARTTGAGIVSPLVLIGAHADTDRIHFAGGDLRGETGPAGKVMTESHRLANTRVPDCTGGLHPQVSAACQLLGVPGLAATLDALSRQTPARASAVASFRLHHGRRRAMVQRPALVRHVGACAPTEP